MKKIIILMLTPLLALSLACGGKKSGEKKSKEPATKEEFTGALNDLGISLYKGSKIIGFKTGANSEMTTVVPADKGSIDDISKHYISQFKKALSGKDKWVKQMVSKYSVLYRKGYTGWNISAAISPKKSKGGYKVVLSYGDNAVSY